MAVVRCAVDSTSDIVLYPKEQYVKGRQSVRYLLITIFDELLKRKIHIKISFQLKKMSQKLKTLNYLHFLWLFFDSEETLEESDGQGSTSSLLASVKVHTFGK